MLYLAVRNNSLKCFQVNFKPCFACIGASNITSFGKVKYPVWRNNPIRRIFHINSVMCCPFWFVFNYIAAHLKNTPIFDIHHKLSLDQPFLKHGFTLFSVAQLILIKCGMTDCTKGNNKGVTSLDSAPFTITAWVWMSSLRVWITTPYTRKLSNLSQPFRTTHVTCFSNSLIALWVGQSSYQQASFHHVTSIRVIGLAIWLFQFRIFQYSALLLRCPYSPTLTLILASLCLTYTIRLWFVWLWLTPQDWIPITTTWARVFRKCCT